MFDLIERHGQKAVIKVIGVGGGGGNAIDHMMEELIDGVDFIAANTDAQALDSSRAQTVLHIGSSVTKGLGAGADPSIGEKAANEDREAIKEILAGADMVFITVGMGGGTGTGAAPVIAEIARGLGVLTVAVVTTPFEFERSKRMKVAQQGIKKLAEHVDSLIVIPNEKLLDLDPDMGLLDAFKSANQVLKGAVQGIAEMITRPGQINVDFADVRTVMSEMGRAMMGSASATGENRAREAAMGAISSPFLEEVSLEGARGILVNITAGKNLSVGEFKQVGEVINQFAAEDATVVIGTSLSHEDSEQIRVTIVITGLDAERSALVVDMDEGRRPLQVVETPITPADYAALDTPTVIRNERGQTALDPLKAADLKYLEVPAFLRRQAD